jgi:hypothetical protein
VRYSRVALSLVLLGAELVRPTVAAACGSSGPDGVSACSLGEYEEAQRPRWRVGVSGVYTSTVISFSSALHMGETRYAALADVAYAPTSRLSFSAGVGAVVGGRLLAPDGAHDFSPGMAADLGASYRVIDGPTPVGHAFLLVSGVVSYSGGTTQLGDVGPHTSYNAFDLRAGAAFGLTWLRTLSAYGVVRAFGGPIFWHYEGASELGTDTHHYQVGGGLALLLFRHVDLFAEGVPLGEQAVAAGVSLAF